MPSGIKLFFLLGVAVSSTIITAVVVFHTPEDERDRLVLLHEKQTFAFPTCSQSPIVSASFSSKDYQKLISKWHNCRGQLELGYESYSGGWKNGLKHYYGVWGNGEDTYEGSFIEGKKSGFGREYNMGQLSNEGYYENGKLQRPFLF